MGKQVVECLLCTGGTVFGGFPRDLLSGELSFSNDIDVCAPTKHWSIMMEDLYRNFGRVEIIPHPSNGYLKEDSHENARVLVGELIQVDFTPKLPSRLDLDINGLLMATDDVGSAHLTCQGGGLLLVNLLDNIKQRRYCLLNNLPWRVKKMLTLRNRGWREVGEPRGSI